jgi:hypothetical protein
MGRATATLGTTDRGARVLDQSTGGVLYSDGGPSGDPAFGPSRTGPVLPGLGDTPEEGPLAVQEVMLQQLWFQLSLPERQRFGHRFSSMVLKALGLRPGPTEEVPA